MQGNKRGIPRLPLSLDYRTEEREGRKENKGGKYKEAHRR